MVKEILEGDNIIDNSGGRELLKVLKHQLSKAQEAKFAIGYFFLSGFNLVKDDFPNNLSKKPFLKMIIGNETTYPTKEELVEGYNLRELFKQRMIEDLQKKGFAEEQIQQLRRLREFIADNIIDVRLYDKSRLHAKLYLFISDPSAKYESPGVAIVGSSNFTAEGITKNRELNVLLTSRADVLYLNHWFDELWDDALEFREDLLRVIEISGAIPEAKYPKLGRFIDPKTLFKYLVYKWTEGRVLNLIEKDILMEFQLVGVINAINILNYYNGVILADSVGLGKSFMAAAVIQEFLHGKHPHWIPNGKECPSVMLILPPSIISQWEDLLVGRADDITLRRLEGGYKVKVNSEFFFKNNYKRMLKGDYNHKVYEIYDESGERLLGKITFLSLGLLQNYKVDLKNGIVDERLKNVADEYDLFIIDEAHKYRNRETNRWNVVRALQRKYNNFPNKFILLTATPLNNTIDDLYNLIRIFTDDTLITFKMKNIPIDELIRGYKSLKREYEEKKDEGLKKRLKRVAIDIKRKVLDEVMVLRTRKYVLEQFEDLKVDGKKLVFKDPKIYSLDYSPFYTDSFNGLMDLISRNIESINFEHTKLYGVRYVVFEKDEEEEHYKIIEVADLFRLLLGKRLESGIFPFETTLRKIYEKEKIFYSIFKKDVDKIMSEEELKKLIIQALEKAKIKKDLEEVSQEFMEVEAEETLFDKVIKRLNEYVEEYNLYALTPIDKIKKGLEIALKNLENDLKHMDEIFDALDGLKIKENGDFKVFGTIPKGEDEIIESKIFCYNNDPKVLKNIITNPKYKSYTLSDIPTLNGKKFIIFTQYKDTAYYLYHNLREWIEREVDLHPWLKDKNESIKIALVTGETDTTTKINYIKRFAPKANAGEDEIRRSGEVEILVANKDGRIEQLNLLEIDEKDGLFEIYVKFFIILSRNVYGVDINSSALKVARARLFLTLARHFNIDTDVFIRFPNIHFNLREGNSLIGYVSLPKQKEDIQLTLDFVFEGNETQHIHERIKVDEELKGYLPSIASALGIEGDIVNEVEEMNRILTSKKIKWNEFEKVLKIKEKLIRILVASLNSMYAVKLNKLLNDITNLFNDKLDEKFAEEYKIGLDDLKKVKTFHWIFEFPEVMLGENQGFDVIVGNPPYGDILNKRQKEICQIYSSYTGEIASIFVERIIPLNKDKGYFSFIITYTITFNKDLSVMREKIYKNYKECYISTFDRDRCRFFDNMTQSVSIMLSKKKTKLSNGNFYTSQMFRRMPEIEKIEFQYANDYLLGDKIGVSFTDKHRLPKIGKKTTLRILEKMTTNKSSFEDLILEDSNKRIWIRTSGNYWYNAWDRMPYQSTKIKDIKVDPDFKDFLLVLINSSTYYLWLRIYGDGRDMNTDIMKAFPIPTKGKIWVSIEFLSFISLLLMNFLFYNFDKEHNRFETSNVKPVIDLCDIVIGKLYGFTKEEIDYILNYEDVIRGGKKIHDLFYILVEYALLSVYKGKNILDTFILIIKFLVYELYFKDKFYEDKLYQEPKEYLLELVSKYLKPINYDRWAELYYKKEFEGITDEELESLEKDNIRTIEEVYKALINDKEISELIDKIRSHEWVRIIEGSSS